MIKKKIYIQKIIIKLNTYWFIFKISKQRDISILIDIFMSSRGNPESHFENSKWKIHYGSHRLLNIIGPQRKSVSIWFLIPHFEPGFIYKIHLISHMLRLPKNFFLWIYRKIVILIFVTIKLDRSSAIPHLIRTIH